MFTVQETIKGFDKYYTFPLKKYYACWFSKNPDSFLGTENELRFIRMRENNPEAILSFVYSSACLNDTTIDGLKTFCKIHKIIPFDFIHDLQPLLDRSSKDYQIYLYAKQEIDNALSKQYGNLAAASDLIRMIIPLIEKLGIYAEFDINCTLSTLGADLVNLKAPALLNIDMIQQKSSYLVSCNTDFIAFSHDPKSLSKLSSAAIKIIHHIQDQMIKNYSGITFKTFFKNTQPHTIKPDIHNIFTDFFKKFPKPTIFDFRKHLSTLSNIPEHLHIIAITAVPGLH